MHCTPMNPPTCARMARSGGNGWRCELLDCGGEGDGETGLAFNERSIKFVCVTRSQCNFIIPERRHNMAIKLRSLVLATLAAACLPASALADNVKARVMQPDGTYVHLHPEAGQRVVNSQLELIGKHSTTV